MQPKKPDQETTNRLFEHISDHSSNVLDDINTLLNQGYDLTKFRQVSQIEQKNDEGLNIEIERPFTLYHTAIFENAPAVVIEALMDAEFNLDEGLGSHRILTPVSDQDRFWLDIQYMYSAWKGVNDFQIAALLAEDGSVLPKLIDIYNKRGLDVVQKLNTSYPYDPESTKLPKRHYTLLDELLIKYVEFQYWDHQSSLSHTFNNGYLTDLAKPLCDFEIKIALVLEHGAVGSQKTFFQTKFEKSQDHRNPQNYAPMSLLEFCDMHKDVLSDRMKALLLPPQISQQPTLPNPSKS